MVKYIISILLFSISNLACADESSSNSNNMGDVRTVVLNDPTEPLGYQSKVVSKKAYRPSLPVLQSVVLESNKRSAIMNNKLYEVGQKVDGYKISRIEKEMVYLVYQSKTYTVSLYSNSERFTQ
ncbi:hypothetical protein N8878_00975 [Psychromonas sp.]|nr:hypothetical protein [Psychromonas sp.]